MHTTFAQRFRWGIIAIIPFALLNILDSLILLCTLGYWGTKLGMRWLFWISKWDARRRGKAQEANHPHLF